MAPYFYRTFYCMIYIHKFNIHFKNIGRNYKWQQNYMQRIQRGNRKRALLSAFPLHNATDMFYASRIRNFNISDNVNEWQA